MPKTITSLACGLAAAATLATCPAPAGANVSTVVTGGTLHITDIQPGGARLTVTCEDAKAYVSGAPAGAACEAIELIVIDSYHVENESQLAGASAEAGFTRLAETRVTAGPGDAVRGGPGREVVTGDYVIAAVETNGGADELNVSGVTGVFDAGPGDDVIHEWTPPVMKAAPTGGEGRDTLLWDGTQFQSVAFDVFVSNGGVVAAGLSWAIASIEAVDARMPGGPQTVDATAASLPVRAHGGPGDDRLLGGAAGDVLQGGAGEDSLDGGPGHDDLSGDDASGVAGRDTIVARDGEPDRVDCGPGEGDSLTADRADAFGDGCELVDLPPLPTPDPQPQPGPGPDTTAPAVRVARATLRGRRLRVVLACPTGESQCLGRATLRGAGRRGVRLGALPVDVAGGRTQTLARRLTRGQRRRLTRARRLAVRVAVRDAAGNPFRRTVRVPLARGRG